MRFLVISIVICSAVLLTHANGVAKLNEGIDWPECDPNVLTWHPHPLSCTKYVLCFHGNPIERLCAPRLHYSREFQHCTFPQLAMCDINYACPEVDDPDYPVFLPDADDCSSYFVCFQGSPIPKKCAEDLWWDVVYEWCNIADEVTCDSRVPNNPRDNTTTTVEPTTTTTETTTTSTTTTSTTTTPTTTTPTTTTPTTTTQNPSTYECPLSSVPTFHPHTLECELYFICINGIAFLRRCADDLLFDIRVSECVEAEDATCISGSTIDESHVLPPLPSGLVCPLQAPGEIFFYPHRESCENYYRCERGVAFLHKCPSSLIYDVTRETCMKSSDALCLQDM